MRPEQVLADVVSGLEIRARQRSALALLLREGPYAAPPELLAEVERGRFTEIAETFICADLAAFLAATVTQSSLACFGMSNSLAFALTDVDSADRRIRVGSNVARGERHDLRDIAFLQMVSLVQLAGVSRIRVCTVLKNGRDIAGSRIDLPCGRLYVKDSKRTYCSTQCRKRKAQQGIRQRLRDQRERERLEREARDTRNQRRRNPA